MRREASKQRRPLRHVVNQSVSGAIVWRLQFRRANGSTVVVVIDGVRLRCLRPTVSGEEQRVAQNLGTARSASGNGGVVWWGAAGARRRRLRRRGPRIAVKVAPNRTEAEIRHEIEDVVVARRVPRTVEYSVQEDEARRKVRLVAIVAALEGHELIRRRHRTMILRR